MDQKNFEMSKSLEKDSCLSNCEAANCMNMLPTCLISATYDSSPFHFVPGHFVPIISSPGHFVPGHFDPGHFVPWSFRPLVISSPGHFVPRSFRPLVILVVRKEKVCYSSNLFNTVTASSEAQGLK